MRIESLNSNDNALQVQGAIDDSSSTPGSGCIAPYNGVTTAGTYHFTLKACDNIGGTCVCSSSDPVNHPNDCTGAHPLTIVVASSVPEPIAAPPNIFIDTTYSLPVGGMTWTVGCITSPHLPGYYLQLALNSAAPGDVIVLQHGCVYTNSDAESLNGSNSGFQVPIKSNPLNKWIYIIPDDYSSLPPPGTRVGPSNVAQMATIAEDEGATAWEFAREVGTTAPSYWRIVGTEFKSTSLVPSGCPSRLPGTYQLNNCGSSVMIIPDHNKLGQPIVTNNLIFDRLYVHGSPSKDVVIGIDLDCITCSVVDSYISDIHATDRETQAIGISYTPGPLKIHNNYIASGGEALFFGGGGAIYSGGNFYDNPYVPSDIEISNNTIGAQIEWDQCGDGGTIQPGETQSNGVPCPAASPSTPGNQWIIKNDLEFKTAQRVLIIGNLIQNSWLSGQTGANFLLEPAAGESGNSTVVQDITFENNIVLNGDQPIVYAGQDYNCDFPYISQSGTPNPYPDCTNESRTQRINIYNNLLIMDPSLDGVHHNGIYFSSFASEAVFNHNTVLMSDGSFPYESIEFAAQGFGAPSPSVDDFAQYNLYFLNNLLGNNPNGDYGVFGTPVGQTLGYYEPDPSTLQTAGRFTGNVVWVPNSALEYDWNTGPLIGNDAVTSVTYSSCGAGNYQLSAPNWSGDTTDGTESGIICSTLCAAGACGGEGTLTIISLSPRSGTVGVAYSYTLAITGGMPPYTWSIVSGSLPAELSLNASTGVISGTPTSAGTATFTVKVTDANLATATAMLSITIQSSQTSFTFSPSSPTTNQSVQFTDTSTDKPTSWLWNFGDTASGQNNTSTLQNPTHTYATAGNYTVTLTAGNGSINSGGQASQMVTVSSGSGGSSGATKKGGGAFDWMSLLMLMGLIRYMYHRR